MWCKSIDYVPHTGVGNSCIVHMLHGVVVRIRRMTDALMAVRNPVVQKKNSMNSKIVLEIRSGDHSCTTPIRRIGASLPRNTRRPPNNHRLFKRLILISNNEKRAASNMETAL